MTVAYGTKTKHECNYIGLTIAVLTTNPWPNPDILFNYLSHTLSVFSIKLGHFIVNKIVSICHKTLKLKSKNQKTSKNKFWLDFVS